MNYTVYGTFKQGNEVKQVKMDCSKAKNTASAKAYAEMYATKIKGVQGFTVDTVTPVTMFDNFTKWEVK